eukprot:SAG11_NODE_6914_length_1226_cov_0.748004_1_plen_156_part_00
MALQTTHERESEAEHDLLCDLEDRSARELESFRRSIAWHTDQCAKLYSEAVSISHKYVSPAFESSLVETFAESLAPSASTTGSVGAPIQTPEATFTSVESAVESISSEKQQERLDVAAQFEALSTPFVGFLSSKWSHEKRKRVLRNQQLHQSSTQ